MVALTVRATAIAPGMTDVCVLYAAAAAQSSSLFCRTADLPRADTLRKTGEFAMSGVPELDCWT